MADEDTFFPGPQEAEVEGFPFPSFLQDAAGVPPPKWQENPSETVQTL